MEKFYATTAIDYVNGGESVGWLKACDVIDHIKQLKAGANNGNKNK